MYNYLADIDAKTNQNPKKPIQNEQVDLPMVVHTDQVEEWMHTRCNDWPGAALLAGAFYPNRHNPLECRSGPVG